MWLIYYFAVPANHCAINTLVNSSIFMYESILNGYNCCVVESQNTVIRWTNSRKCNFFNDKQLNSIGFKMIFLFLCFAFFFYNTSFHHELKCFGQFALGLALDIIPISTCSPEDAPDMYNLNRVETSRNNSTSVRGAPVLNLPPNELCRQKMSEIVIDMVDNGML